MPTAKGLGNRPLRGAMLGAGSISVHHLRAWRSIPDVEIVALANRTPSRAEALARETGFEQARIYDDHRRLLHSERVDFVDVTTAPDIHRAGVLAAAAHGVHVLCQKPFATSNQEAVEMIEACEAAGVRCVVNENWRWRRWYRDVKTLLADGVIGQPRYARFTLHSDGVLPEADGTLPTLLTRQPYTAAMPRLILYEWGVHLIDVLRFLFGDVEWVHARMSCVSTLVQGEDMALVTLAFQSGLTGLLDISWGSRIPAERRLERGSLDSFVVEGDAGSIELDPFQDDLTLLTTAKGTERRPARSGITRAEAYQESFNRAHRHFIRCLQTGEPAETEARHNLNTFAAMMAAYTAAAQNRIVPVEV